jgi:hypothetical protein
MSSEDDALSHLEGDHVHDRSVASGRATATRSSVLERRRPLLKQRPLAPVLAEPGPLELGDRLRPAAELGQGAKFAAVALSRRHREHDPDLGDDAARYVEMAECYRQAAIATYRAHRDQKSTKTPEQG